MSIQEALDKYRVETHSKIIPYVIRDHAWNFGHHDDTNFYRYRDDAPEGYKDAIDYRVPHPTNVPVPPKVIVDIKEKEEEDEEVFLVTAAVYAVGALLYGLLASGEKQPWADGEEGLIECEAEKGERRSDGDSYGATGGTQEQECDGEEGEVEDGAYGGEYEYVEGEYEYGEDEE
jgi:hypothetical protein